MIYVFLILLLLFFLYAFLNYRIHSFILLFLYPFLCACIIAQLHYFVLAQLHNENFACALIFTLLFIYSLMLFFILTQRKAIIEQKQGFD